MVNYKFNEPNKLYTKTKYMLNMLIKKIKQGEIWGPMQIAEKHC